MLAHTTRSIGHLIHSRKYWCLFFLFLIINLVVIHRSLVEPGLILAGDFTRAEDFSSWAFSLRYPLWNEHGQSSNLETLWQLGLFAPAIAITSVIEIPSTIVYLAYFLVLGSLSGVFLFKLAEYLMIRQKITPRFEFPLAASLFFMFATFIVETTFHPGIAFGFYLSPLLIYTVIRGVEENKISYLLLSSLVLSLMAVALHFVVFGLIIILSYILYDMLYKIVVQRSRSFSGMKRATWYALIIIGPFIAFSSYWIIPNAVYGGLGLYYNFLTTADAEILYRNADIMNIFSVKGVFALYEIYPYTASELAYVNILSIILTVAAASSLLLYRHNKFVLYLGILLIFSVIISIIPYYLPDLYNWFIFDLPGSFLYSWVFRTPKFFHFMSISIAVMISLSGIRIYHILHKRQKRFIRAVPSIFIVIVLVLSLVPNYILLTGDFNGHHQSHDLPGDYAELLTFLESQDKNYKSIWGPPYVGLSSTWTDNKILDLEEQISPVKTFSGEQTLYDYLYPLIFGIRLPYGTSMVYEEQTDNLDEFLSPINVKHIVLHDDIPSLKNRVEKVSTALHKQGGLSEIKEFGSVTLYSLNDVAEQFSAKPNTMLIQGGGLLRFESAFGIESISSNTTAAFFSDMSLDLNPKMWNLSDTVVSENKLSYAEYMLDKSDTYVISPSDHTNDYSPSELWSKSSSNIQSFWNNLARAGIELPYQFDYGSNIVFTSASNAQLEVPLSESDPGEYRVLTRYFANDKGGLIDLAVNEKSLTLDTRSQLNRFTWTDLGAVRLSEDTQKLHIENRNGFNALNLIALVPIEKYEQYKAEFTNSLVDKGIIHIFEAESDFNFGGTRPLMLHDIGYSNGRAIELRTEEVASSTFEILKGGNYNLDIYGEGTAVVEIDGEISRTINLVKGIPHSEKASFDFGDHSIKIAPASGSNSVHLDSVLMASIRTHDGQSSLIQQQQQQGEEPIIKYHRIDPTNYEVTVKSQSPFMLAFAEAYDERWSAEVKSDNGVKTYKPLPLYGAINGFMIDTEGGDHVINIKYAPQEIFYAGAGISAISYVLVIVYLIRTHHPTFLRGRNN